MKIMYERTFEFFAYMHVVVHIWSNIYHKKYTIHTFIYAKLLEQNKEKILRYELCAI